MTEKTCLTIALSHLDPIALPDLPLPPSTFEVVDENRVNFGIRYYVYASIAHVRKVLRGLVQVSDEANWSCANILARHLMEWAAHSTFAKVKLPSLVRSKRWDKAWSILLQLNGSDLYFRRFGGKYLEGDSKSTEIPEPFAIANLLNVYDLEHAGTQGRGDAKEDYSLLSELSHASAACLRQRMETHENRIVFIAGEDDISPLSIASVSIIDWLLSVAELLSLVSDQPVGPNVYAAIREISDTGVAS